MWALEQDSIGFLWVGAEAGLFRFDGERLEHWAPDGVPGPVMDVSVAADGTVVALDGAGVLHRIDGRSARAEALPVPVAATPRRVGRFVVHDDEGRLWLAYGGQIAVRGTGGWRTVGAEALGGEAPIGIFRGGPDGTLAATAAGLWRVPAAGAPRRLFRLDVSRRENLVAVMEPEPGRVLVLVNVTSELTPRVVEVRGGEERTLVGPEGLPEGRAIAFAERGGALWLALDTYLVVVRPGAEPETMGVDQGYPSGGPLLVDHEGSLWLGTYLALLQLAEPDTRRWGAREGLPTDHTRFLGRSSDAIWVMTWAGAARLDAGGDGWSPEPAPWDTRSDLCTTPDGVVWTGSTDAVLRLAGRDATAVPGLRGDVHGCVPDRSGGVWIGTADGLARVSADGQRVRRIPRPAPDRSDIHRPALLHDRAGRVWVGAGEELCHADAAELDGDSTPAWVCRTVATPSGILRVAELDDGRLWAATGAGGLLEHDGSEWRRQEVPGVPTQTVHAVIGSPRGGAWLAGDGFVVRARSAADGPEIIERLTGWHGLGTPSASHVLEEPGGDLWLATNQGVTHLPASVRFASGRAPEVAFVGGWVDDRPAPEPIELGPDDDVVELRFAALSFRHRQGLLHQVRLGPDRPWVTSAGPPTFRWVDLPGGRYRVEYRASLDGVAWSPSPAAITLRVRPPWYETRTFFLLALLATVGLVAVIHRARVARVVGLERQRTRIALDLHDQIGSGLASVGILSSLVASDDVDRDERHRTAREIAGAAEELGHALSDIVWSLDPEMAGLDELGARLATHGGRLFADEVEFEARVPDAAATVRPSVAVRRNVLLIGLEALHNAARHAMARKVLLALEPADGGRWSLTVRDDGVGLGDPSAAASGGRGLGSMARRAEAIGARLEISAEPGSGTAVVLVFPLTEPRRVAGLGAWLRGTGGRGG